MKIVLNDGDSVTIIAREAEGPNPPVVVCLNAEGQLMVRHFNNPVFLGKGEEDQGGVAEDPVYCQCDMGTGPMGLRPGVADGKCVRCGLLVRGS